MTPLLELVGARKSFGGETALDGLDLSVGRGEFVAVMGPSGCGKTTALRILAGFERPDSGEVRLNGRRVNDLPPWRRNMPMVWQNLALFPFLTARENVEFGPRMRGDSAPLRREKAARWLEKLAVGELADRPVTQLSGGQRQRVALARTLATEPEILLLDEPLSALDANMVVHMQGVLSRLQRETGVAFLYVTHSRSEAFAMADRVAVMGRGKVRQAGTPREIYRAPRSRFVAEFIGGKNVIRARTVGVDGGEVRAQTGDGVFRLPLPAEGARPAPGAAVEFVVGADDARVFATADAADGENSIACDFAGEEFVGDSAMLHLRSASGVKLMAQVNAERLERLGDLRARKLRFAWDFERGRVLPEIDAAAENGKEGAA